MGRKKKYGVDGTFLRNVGLSINGLFLFEDVSFVLAGIIVTSSGVSPRKLVFGELVAKGVELVASAICGRLAELSLTWDSASLVISTAGTIFSFGSFAGEGVGRVSLFALRV